MTVTDYKKLEKTVKTIAANEDELFERMASLKRSGISREAAINDMYAWLTGEPAVTEAS